MATMLNVFDRKTRKKLAVLQNAYSIIETQELNQIYSLSFTLPAEDPKTQYCLPRNYVRYGESGELYRIKAPKISEGNITIVTYECEHVITTLCDNVMFGSFTYGGAGVKTKAVITWILNQQKEKNWSLGSCEFDRKFEYNWEEENLLNALYSVPKEFTEAYKWTFETAHYPWTISLKKIDTTAKPEYYLRAKSNILASGTAADYANICTRIYPLGYGEGVNQLTIRTANNDVPYIQSPQSIVDQYGIVEKVLVDRRFENAETLMAYAQSMLDIYQTPTMSRTFDVTDIYPLTSQSWDDAQVGKICKMTEDGTTAYITKTRRQWDKAGDLQIDLSTKSTGIAQNVADLADRIRIESVYAQGATQLYQHSKDANATPEKGMILSLYFPAEMKQINKILLRLKLNRFRSYSQTTDNNGGYDTTLTIEAKEEEITSQTNVDNSSVQITFPEKIATTDMTADKNMNLTTTAGGGATGTTSTVKGAPDVELIAVNTGDVNWTFKAKPYTDMAEPDMHINSAGEHKHTADVTGNTDSAELIINTFDVYYHSHSLMAAGISMDENGGHRHTGYVDEHNHTIPRRNLQHNHSIEVQNNSGIAGYAGFDHAHNFSLPNHTHKLNIAHQHKVSIGEQTVQVPCPKHKHKIKLPGHSHTINIPAHHHGIESGIFESSETPTAFDIYVSGKKKTTVNATSYDGDITTWLLNSKNQIPRNTWIDVEIRPNAMAYVISSVFVQGFVQSRGGGNY